MKKRMMTTAGAVMAAAMMMNSVSVMAQTIPGASTTFTKELTKDTGALVPGVTFSFTIEAGTAVPAETVYAGAAGATIGSAVFTQGGTESVTVTADFTQCDFERPGFYRYKITEQANDYPNAITNDAHAVRYLDVMVVNDDATGGLKVEGYTLYQVEADGTISMQDNKNVKSTGYVNAFQTVDLNIKNATIGNLADKKKQFTYTVSLKDGIPGSEYTITMYEKNGTVKKTEKITIAQDGTASYEFTLSDGEYAEIPEIAKGTGYKVEEKPEDYAQSKADVENYKDAEEGTLSADTNTSYTNKKEGILPTGVILTIAPFAGAALIGAAGMALKSRKKRDDEEE